MVRVKPYIYEISIYSPPWSKIDRTQYMRLDLNENTLNPPEHVKDALKRYIDSNRIQMYPDTRHFISKLASYTGMNEDHLIVANGSDQAIEVVLRAFLAVGDEILITSPSFPMFTQIANVIGAKIKTVPYDSNLRFPYTEFVNAISSQTKLIVLINPDNPTGSSMELSQIRNILEIAPDIPVIADEAYFEFTGKTVADLIDRYPNLIVLRTFSKAFAMAGLRLGYIMAQPELITQFYKIRGPFDVNSCAMIAAEAQLDNQSEWKAYIDEVMNRSKPLVEAFFRSKSVKYYPAAAHFMLVEPEDRDKAVHFLKDNGILVRPMVAPSIIRTFRMNVGTVEQSKRFIEVFEAFLEQK